MDNSDIIKKRIEWMGCTDRTDDLYLNGVKEFLDFAFGNLPSNSNLEEDEITVPCPCYSCNNKTHKTRENIYDDLLINGIVQGYIRWIYHGEHKSSQKRSRAELGENDEIFTMIRESRAHFASEAEIHDEGFPTETPDSTTSEHPFANMNEANIVDKLMEEAQKSLYPGCDEHSKLSFILKLFQIKCLNGITNKAFSSMLQMFKSVLPKGADIPSSYYEARKMITDLGFDYVKIEACENDCMLFWKEDSNLTNCKICDKARSKTSSKVLRYFPLTPRLQRLYASSKTAKDMRWHSERRVNDGVLRHPADSQAWAHLDKENEFFSSDPRSVRLGLASDGFNPFGGLRSDYSIWPVVLAVYNLPPWMCMKQPYTFMSLLIPGKSSPGNNIDVYLQPLIDELKNLWTNGVKTYDVYKKEYFKMHAAVLWTINDFPAYANLSGWSTKGYKACPCCMTETSSLRLPNCRKICYMDHRRFLPENHKWRDSKTFNGKIETRGQPRELSGEEILSQLSDFDGMPFGKTVTTPKRSDNWRKKSIFFELPYWSSLLLRHNLDVMHIEKNVCDNILGTLLDIAGKSKDSLNARHDLKCVKMMRHLAAELVNGKWHIPPASYTLSKSEKETVCKFLEEIKVPDGYSSNFPKCINLEKQKISGLKTHDCHVLLEQLLPLAIRGVSKPAVYEVINKLSIFFKDLCSKSLKPSELKNMEDQIFVTLCEMEKIFLPSFFDVMIHLCVHLAAEAKICGPVQYRWMYPIERLLRKFKCYVRNKSRPEGSIAEGYILEECMLFCSKYLHDIETRFNQPERNADGDCVGYEGLSVFAPSGVPLGKAKARSLTNEELSLAQDYILKNCDEAQPYFEEYAEGPFDNDITDWLRDRAEKLLVEIDNQEETNIQSKEKQKKVARDLRTLALGPLRGVQTFTGYIANGFRFHTRDTEKKRRNQNSGVMVKGGADSEQLDYFGVLTDIISLQYLDGKRVILFRCDWWDVHTTRGVKLDKYGCVSVNTQRKLRTNEPFCLMSQAEQVFYVRDGFDPNWLVVIKTHPRHNYNIPENEVLNDDEALQQSHLTSSNDQIITTIDVEETTLFENQTHDLADIVIDATDENQPRNLNENESDDEDDYIDDYSDEESEEDPNGDDDDDDEEDFA